MSILFQQCCIVVVHSALSEPMKRNIEIFQMNKIKPCSVQHVQYAKLLSSYWLHATEQGFAILQMHKQQQVFFFFFFGGFLTSSQVTCPSSLEKCACGDISPK